MGVESIYGQSQKIKLLVGTLAKPSNLYIALLSKIQNAGVGSAVDPTSTEALIATVASSSSNLTEDSDTGGGAVDANYVRTAISLGDANWTYTAGSAGNPAKATNTNAISITVPTGGLTSIVGWALCWSSTIGAADNLAAGAFSSAQQGSYLAGETIQIAANALSITEQDSTVAN
jgi:hypothetical protein